MNPWLKRLYDLAPTQSRTCWSAPSARGSNACVMADVSPIPGAAARKASAGTRRAWAPGRTSGCAPSCVTRTNTCLTTASCSSTMASTRRVSAGARISPKIPVLTRDTVKRRQADLKSRRPEDRTLAEGHTSGTTGSPLSMCYSDDVITMNYAVMDRQYRLGGPEAGARRRSRGGGARQCHRAAQRRKSRRSGGTTAASTSC